MFHLSRKIDYGLVLLLALAEAKLKQDEKPLSLRELSKKRYLSFFFLQKVAHILKEKGLIEANRGKNGGYFLSKFPNKISLKEIFESLEGPVAVMYCLDMSSKDTCIREKGCTPRRGLAMLNDELHHSLNKITLADFFTQPTHAHARN